MLPLFLAVNIHLVTLNLTDKCICIVLSVEFAPHAAAWKRYGVALKKQFPYGVHTHERTPEEFFDGNPNSEDAVNAFNTAKDEIRNFKKGNYEYEPNGRGWHLKDNMDESIRRAIRKVLG